MQHAIAANRAREDSVDALHGFFVSDTRRSQYEMGILQRMAQANKPAGNTRDAVPVGLDRTLCAGAFVAARDRIRVDGIVVSGEGGNPWGFKGRAGAHPLQDATAADPRSGADAQPAARPRTVIIRDGERAVEYYQALGIQMSTPQVGHGPAASQQPLDRLLFCRLTVHPFSKELEVRWKAAAGGSPTMHTWEYLGVEQEQGLTCDKLRDTWGTRSIRPGVVAHAWSCFWVAPQLGLAPVRVEQLERVAGPDGQWGITGDLWLAEAYDRAPDGSWMPRRVRLERGYVLPTGQVQWATITVVEFTQMEINQPIDATDFTLHGPPLDTHLMENAALTPEWERAGRGRALSIAAAWLTPPAIMPDTGFAGRMKAFAAERPLATH